MLSYPATVISPPSLGCVWKTGEPDVRLFAVVELDPNNWTRVSRGIRGAERSGGGSGMGRSQNVPIAAFDAKMALAGNSPDSLAFGRPRKHKENPGELRVSEINAAF